MQNRVELQLCIADMNDLITHALRDHVLKTGEYEVQSVNFDRNETHFKIVLEPKVKA